MNNKVVDYTSDYVGKIDFDRLITIVHSIIKKNLACDFDKTLFDLQYYFKIYDYLNDIKHIFNPWCIIVEYGKNNKKKTMRLYYEFYIFDKNGTEITSPITKKLNRALEGNKDGTISLLPDFDGQYGKFIAKCLQGYLALPDSNDRDKFNELLEHFKDLEYDKCNKLARGISDQEEDRWYFFTYKQYAQLYTYYWQHPKTRNLICIFPRHMILHFLSEKIAHDIRKNHSIVTNTNSNMTHFSIIYNMNREHEQCLYARNKIQSILQSITTTELKNLNITISKTQDRSLSFDEKEFSSLKRGGMSVIIN